MKAYRSPLHLIPKASLSSLSEDRLRRIRKEVMLQFELSDSTTIQVNGRTYDRTEVLQAFEQLEKDFQYHLFLFQDKALLRFVEGEDISLFYENRKWEELGESSFINWLTPFFQERLGKTISQCIQKPGFFSIKKLRALNESSLQIPYSISYQSYTKPYEELNYTVQEAVKVFSRPFSSARGLRLKKELESHLSIHLLNVFKWLPSEFYGLRERYTIAAHNMLAEVFNRNRYFKNYRVEELKLMRIAAQFSSNYRPDLKATELLYQLNRAIEERVNYNVPAVITGAIMVIIIIAIYSISSNSSSRNLSRSLSSAEVIFNTPTAIKSSLTGKTWIDTNKKQNKESRLPLHFFTFFNDDKGEHGILLPLEEENKYVSVSIPFKWGVLRIGEASSSLTIAYTSPMEVDGLEGRHLTKAQEKLLEDIKRFLVVPSVKYPIDFEFPNRITFKGFLPEHPLHSAFVPLRGAKTWEVVYGVKAGEYPFVDRLIAASNATDHLLQHASLQNKNKGFKLYVHPYDMSIYLQRGLNSVAIGQFVKTRKTLVFNPYKWVQDSTELPTFFIGLREISYFDDNEDIKTGDLKIYYPSFSTDTAKVILR